MSDQKPPRKIERACTRYVESLYNPPRTTKPDRRKKPRGKDRRGSVTIGSNTLKTIALLSRELLRCEKHGVCHRTTWCPDDFGGTSLSLRLFP